MTATPIVAPDVGLLIAHGLGPKADPNAGEALASLAKARELGARLVRLPSVRDELERKLRELDSTFVLAKEILARSQARYQDPASLPELERVISELRRDKHAMRRYLNLVERQAVTLLKEEPGCSWGAMLALLFRAIIQAQESIRMRVQAIQLEEVELDSLSPEDAPPRIPEVKGDDRRHLEGCLALSKKEGTGVLFLVFESPLQGRKGEIEKAFPGVRISSPTYLESYLTQDASQWADQGRATTQV